MKDPGEADEIFSSVWVKFFRYAEKKEIEMKTVKALIYKIAGNLIIDFYRKKNKLSLSSLDKELNEDHGTYYDLLRDPKASDPMKENSEKELAGIVSQEVAKLPDKQQEAFILRFMEDFSFKELADIQGVPIATALARVRYALKKIQKTLQLKGVSYGA